MPRGRSTYHSGSERRQSGHGGAAIGRTLFTEIAPCMDNPQFHGRIGQALTRGTLDVAFDYIADFPSGARKIKARVQVQSAGDGGCWIFMQFKD